MPSSDLALLALLTLAFIIQPAMTLAISILLAWSHPKARISIPVVLIFGAAYLALINVTKLPESDLANYLESFYDAQHLDLATFLLLNAREPLYYVSLFGFANLHGVDGRVFVFLSTFVPYVIFCSAVLRLGIALSLNRRALLCLLLFLLFFAQLFSLSAHLFRQFLASSLVMLFLADHAVTGRRRWLVGLLGIMIHYSSMPLILLTFMRPPKRYSATMSLLLQILTLSTAYILAITLAPLLLEVPVLGMVFQRIANGEGAELDPLTPSALGMATIFLSISLFSLASTNKHALGAQDWSILLCTVIVCVIVLGSSAQPNLSEIAIRYFFYLYFMIGLVLPFLMVRVPVTCMLVNAGAILSLPLFFYKLAYGEWTFAPVGSLLFEPAWMLWKHQVLLSYSNI